MKRLTLLLATLALSLFTMVNTGLAQDQKPIIRKGDKLNILVVNSNKDPLNFAVSQNGYVLIPGIGKVLAGGRTVEELEADLKERYKKLYPNPKIEVTIEAAQQASRSIFVLGQVNIPGQKDVKSSMSVVKILAMAGGLSAKASETDIQIIRTNQSADSFNYAQFVKTGSGSITVNPGDVVLVRKKKASSAIHVIGSVKNPGKFTVDNSITFLEALAMAGGIAERANPNATIIRQGGKPQEMKNIRQLLTSDNVRKLMVNPGDTVLFSEGSSQGLITVSGAVNVPGRFPIKGKSVNLIKALGLAGGVSQGAGVVRLISKSGEIKTLDIRTALNVTNVSQLPSVSGGDTVLVDRATPQQIYVFGRVKTPGAFTITGPVKLHQALALAGDVTKWGSRNGIKVIRSDGSTKTYDLEDLISENPTGIPQLNAGDTVYVP